MGLRETAHELYSFSLSQPFHLELTLALCLSTVRNRGWNPFLLEENLTDVQVKGGTT
jgi:hypothetical protein